MGRGTNSSYPQILRVKALEINDVIIEALEIFQTFEKLSDQCIESFIYITCIAGAPPCDSETGLPVLICEDQCDLFNKVIDSNICHELDDSIQSFLTSTLSDTLQGVVDVYYNFNCSDPATYFFANVTESDPNVCTSLYSPDIKG